MSGRSSGSPPVRRIPVMPFSVATSMSHSKSDQLELRRDRFGDTTQNLTRRRVPLVGEPFDALAVIVIADITREGDNCAGAVIADGILHCPEIKGTIDCFNKTDCAHAPITIRLGAVSLGTYHTRAIPRGVPVHDVLAELGEMLEGEGATVFESCWGDSGRNLSKACGPIRPGAPR